MWHKAEFFLDELGKLTRSDAWASQLTMVPPELRPAFAECIQSLTFKHSADFDRRINHCIVKRSPWWSVGRDA